MTTPKKKGGSYIEENELLRFLLERDKINIDDALKDFETMKREKILKQHDEKYGVWKATDGRYKTKLPDGSKYGKLVAKSTLENLENCIVEFYTANEKKADTLEALYPDWIEYKRKESSLANANKLQWVWNTYFKDSNISKMRIKDIKTITVKKFALDTVDKFKLTKKKYTEFKTALNSILDYAIECELVTVNVSRNVRQLNKHKFAPTVEKDVTEQIYIDNEEQNLINVALKQYEKTKNTAYLAVCMNFYLGLRVGELVALRVDDFSKNAVSIKRQEVKSYIVVDGESHRNGYEIANYTKTEEGTRTIICVSKAKEYFDMIVKANKEHGFEGGYLLINDKGERMHDFSVNNVLRRLNKKINTTQKGNHKIRKTCISNLANSGVLTDEDIMKFAGHNDFATTKTYYIFRKEEDKQDAFEKALVAKNKAI